MAYLSDFINHVAIVQSNEAVMPKVIHLTNSGILLNEISERTLNKKIYHAFRFTEQSFAEEAAVVSYNWLINNNYNEQLSSTDKKTVLVAAGILNRPALELCVFRSSDYGTGARRFVRRLCRECKVYPPREFTGSAFFYDGAAFCSGFVIAAYQAAIGEELCPTRLAIDARTTLPSLFFNYLKTNTFWDYVGKTQLRKKDA
ncbi:hypothetical protein [Candidatus Sororendozoicomonas aggregata]|uniref:hypothetical protein n=1 Tax=Candidatus Sororendozoicomonas aggregata TaxID=3073239 RepID=UPI002ED34505